MIRRTTWLVSALALSACATPEPAQRDARSDSASEAGSNSDGSTGNDVVSMDVAPSDGATTDTGVAMDSGVGVDSGVAMDSGVPTDAGVVLDTGVIVDTGVPVDTGVATCPGSRTSCGGVCVDLQSDSLNCGRCGTGCSTGDVCAAGSCTAALRGLVISELRPAATPYIELYNGSNTAIDLNGYRVQWSTEGGGTGSVTLPAFSLAPGAFVTLRSGSAAMMGADWIGLGMSLTWSSEIAVRLLSPGGLGLDFVRTGPSTAPAPAGTNWVGANTPNPTAATDQVLVRAVFSPDTDSAADWSLQGRASPGAFCAVPGRCGASCVSFDSDRDNCGSCGFRCSGTQVCRSGVCVAGTGRPWLSEYRLSGRPGVEIHNPSSMPISLMGYRIQVAPVSGTTLSFFLPAFTLPAGGFVWIYAGAGTNDATSIYTNMTMGFDANAAISLFDSASTGIDYVRVGSSMMAPPAGLSWFGASVTAPPTAFDQSIVRDISTFDTDSAADWTLSSPSSPGYLCNAGLTLCGGRCVDRAVDRAHCGACGAACGAHQTCIAGACRSVDGLVLSELAASTQSFELFNGTSAAINLGGYILDWVADGGSATYTIPAGTMIPSGGFVRFRPGAGTSSSNDIYMGAGVSVAWTTFVAVSIRNAMNVAIDFVKTGTAPTPAPSGTTWSGMNATNPDRGRGESLVRNVWAADSNSSADWTITATATPLSYCAAPTASTVMCGTSCVDTQRSASNCGACGNRCNSAFCQAGRCSDVPLYHGWVSPIAGCDTGSYNATSATPLGGVYPYNAGDSNACRAWKLAATVCNTQPLMYVDTTNWSCSSSGGFTDPVFGTFCAVSNQYSCSTCPGACNAGSCSYGPISLRNCAGSETRLP